MRWVFLFFLISLTSVSGFEFVFVPDYAPYAKTIFTEGPVPSFGDASFWGKIKFLLNREGYAVSAMSVDEMPKKPSDTQFVFWSGAMPLEKAKQYPSQNLAILMFEPPSVVPWVYSGEYISRFSKIISWYDDWIDGQKFHKFCYAVCLPMTKDLIPFSERKFCCVMAANKKSTFAHELYSERVRAIQYFNQFPDQFDLYGPDWGNMGFSVYRGWVDDKVRALRNYKFSICYENTREASGYITEKIFDCFQAGTVPVYLGAPNIAEEVPANCFIDRRNFGSYEELHAYLLSITEDEFEQYLANMRQFVASEQAKKYTVDGSVLAIVSGLIGRQLTWDDLPK